MPGSSIRFGRPSAASHASRESCTGTSSSAVPCTSNQGTRHGRGLRQQRAVARRVLAQRRRPAESRPSGQRVARGQRAEVPLHEARQVHDARQRHERVDALVARRAQQAHRAAEAVADADEAREARRLRGVEHAAEVVDFLAGRHVLEAALGAGMAGEGEAQGGDAGAGQRVGELDEVGAVLVRGDAVGDDGHRARARGGVERRREAFSVTVAQGGEGRRHAGRAYAQPAGAPSCPPSRPAVPCDATPARYCPGRPNRRVP